MKSLLLAALAISLTGCATTLHKLTVANPATGEVIEVEGYSSTRDIEIERTADGWRVRASSSTPMAAFADAAVRIFQAGVKAGTVAK